jgi:hypothetical protein
MKSGERNLGQKAELTDLEKADCLPGKAMGGIVLKAPGHGERKRRRGFSPIESLATMSCHEWRSGICCSGTVEKEALWKLMRRMERFTGLEILTYAGRGNHCHILLRELLGRHPSSRSNQALCKTVTEPRAGVRNWAGQNAAPS